METIGLQEKARPLQGTIEHYWFENVAIDERFAFQATAVYRGAA